MDLADLPPRIRDAHTHADALGVSPDRDFYRRVELFERKLLEKELQALDGNIKSLALALGMDRSHLYAKLRSHGLSWAGSSRRAPVRPRPRRGR